MIRQKKDEYINFVLAFDKGYILQAAVTITSILVNLDYCQRARFFLLTENVTDKDLEKLYRCAELRAGCQIINIPVNPYLHYFKSINVNSFVLKHVSLACYYRLLMFIALPEDVEKCFYVDSDMIVDADLGVLWDDFNEDKILGVVVENFAMVTRKKTLSHLKKIAEFKSFCQNPQAFPYFNAGFLLFNIKKAKEERIFEQCLNFLEKNPNPPYADQDTLNAVIGQRYISKIKYFPAVYNVFCDFGVDKVCWNKGYYNVEEMKNALKKPYVYHYAGSLKPWITNNQKFHDMWWKYYKVSPYKDVEMKPKRWDFWKAKTYYLFSFFPLLSITIKATNSYVEHKIRLFGFFVIFRSMCRAGKCQLMLLNFIPIFKFSQKRITYVK